MGTTLTGTFISQTYDSLIKVTDNDNLTSTAKRLTDGLGNDSPLFLSTTKLGVGITPTTTFQVSGNSQLGGNLTVTGNLIVQGTTTTVDTDTLSVKDPLIIVGSDNTSSDAVDLGFYGVYDTSGSLDLYAGLFRDASDAKFHLFKDLQTEPTTTVNKSATGYTKAGLVVGSLEATTGSFTGNIELDAASGFAQVELGGPSGAIIDLKKPFSDDYDLRLTTATDSEITASGTLKLNAGNTLTLTLDGSNQSATFTGNIIANRASGDHKIIPSTGQARFTIESPSANGNNVYLALKGPDTEWRFITNRGDLNGGNQGDLFLREETQGVNVLTFVTNTGDANFVGDLTVSGGDITLGGTGRIQGIDTVSASTDAASKGYVDTQITAQDLDFAGGSGTGSVDLDSQTFTIAGTSNEIETSASGQTITVGLPSTVVIGTSISSPIFGLGEGVNNKIFFLGNYGNWRINISDSANQLVIHSESLAADHFTVKGGGTIQLNNYGSGNKTGTVAKNLAVDSSGNIIETDGSVVDGSGTANDVVMWSDSNTLTDAPIAISGNNATFAGIVSINGAGSASSGSLSLVSTDSFIRINTTGGTTDKQKWDIRTISASGLEALEFRTVNDANNSFSTKLSLAHSGTATFAGDVTTGGKLEVTHDTNFVGKFTNTATSMSNNNYTLMVDSSSHTSNMSAAGAFNVAVNSGNAFTIAGNGNSTFGGDVTATSKKFISTSSSSGDYVRLYAGSGTAQWDIYGNGENLRLSENSSGGGIFQVDSGASFAGQLTVDYSTADAIIRLAKGSSTIGNIDFVNEGNRFSIQDDGTRRLVIDSSGNVGIGTVPNNKFHVHGGDNSIYAIFARSDSKFLYLHSGATDPAIGFDTGGALRFGTATSNVGASFSEKMRLTNSGNLGLGTDSPSSYNASGDDLVIFSSGNTGMTIASSDTSSEGTIRFADGTGGTAGYRGSIQYQHNGDIMNFNTAASEKMRIDSSGNLGIGSNSPSSYNAQLVSFKDGGSFAYLGHNNSGGTFPKVSALSFGSSAVSFSHTTNGGTNALTGSAQIAAIQSASSNAVTDMAFYTTSGGSVTEKMRITSSAEGHIELSGTAPLIKATASNGGSGLRINVAAQSGGNIFRVQENGTTLFQIDDGGPATFAGDVTIGTGIIKGSIGSDIAITQGSIGLRINDAASAISPTTATANNDNAVDLGVSNIRFKDLFLGGNITSNGTSITLDSAGSADYIADRLNDTSGSTYQYKTNGSLKWYHGLRGLSNNDFYLFNNTASENALVITESGSNATFAGVVTANDSIVSQADDAGFIARNAAGTVIGTMGAESSSTPNVGKLTVRNNGNTRVNFNSNGDSYINGGNLGISNTSPSSKIHIGSNSTSGAVDIGLQNSSRHYTIKTDGGNLKIKDESAGSDRITLNSSGATDFAGDIRLVNNGVERFIKSTANGGAIKIVANSGATTNPDRGLFLGRIDNNDNFSASLSFHNGDNAVFSGNVTISSDGDATQLKIKRSSASQDNGLQLQDQNGNKQAIFNLEGSSTNDLQIASTQKIKFFTGSNCSNPPTNQRMEILSSGEVLIGGSGTGDLYLGNIISPSSSNRGMRLHTNNSDAFFDFQGVSSDSLFFRDYDGSGGIHTRHQFVISNGNIVAAGSIIENGSPSDIKYKENIKTISNGIDKIEKLNPVEFDWNDKSDAHKIGKKEDAGFIAQEVQKVLPNLVNENVDGDLALNYEGIIPYLVQSIQELKKEIEILKNK